MYIHCDLKNIINEEGVQKECVVPPLSRSSSILVSHAFRSVLGAGMHSFLTLVCPVSSVNVYDNVLLVIITIDNFNQGLSDWCPG